MTCGNTMRPMAITRRAGVGRGDRPGVAEVGSTARATLQGSCRAKVPSDTHDVRIHDAEAYRDKRKLRKQGLSMIRRLGGRVRKPLEGCRCE